MGQAKRRKDAGTYPAQTPKPKKEPKRGILDGVDPYALMSALEMKRRKGKR